MVSSDSLKWKNPLTWIACSLVGVVVGTIIPTFVWCVHRSDEHYNDLEKKYNNLDNKYNVCLKDWENCRRKYMELINMMKQFMQDFAAYKNRTDQAIEKIDLILENQKKILKNIKKKEDL